MATKDFRFPKDRLVKLIISYLAIGEFLEEIIGPGQIYTPNFIKGMREALADLNKKRIKRVLTIHDLAR